MLGVVARFPLCGAPRNGSLTKVDAHLDVRWRLGLLGTICATCRHFDITGPGLS